MSVPLIDQEVLPLLSQLIDLRLGRSAGHQLELADLARRISVKLEHPPEVTREIYIATLLCRIGFIALPDLLIKSPYQSLSPENRNKVDQSAIDGAAILASTSFLIRGAEFVKHQYERFDGHGYPDRISGTSIPIGSRILAVVVDFDDLQTGSYFGKRLGKTEAKSLILDHAGNKFDPEIVSVFADLLDSDESKSAQHSEVIVPFENLEAGMVLAQDVLMTNGLILLRKGKILAPEDLEALARVSNLYPTRIQFYVRV